MKPLQMKLIWILIFTKLPKVVLPSSTDIFTEYSDLFELCPYTSFCGQNVSSAFPFSEEYQPCCRPCSCDPDCGFHGDCCFSRIDNMYKETPHVVCRSGFADEPPTIEFPEAFTYRFRMISECRNSITGSKMNETSCENPSNEFHPVVSISTNFVYVNEFCALCNNVSDTVPWRQAVTCTPGAELLMSESLRRLKNPNSSAAYGCYLYYIPPEGFDISPSSSCSPVVVKTCNKRFWNHSIKNRELCETFNATFTVQINNIERLYANIYCFLCNTNHNLSSRPEIQRKHCLKFENLHFKQRYFESKLTVILNTRNGDPKPAKGHEEGSVCPKNSVLVSSFKKKCRQVLCPWGQFLLNNRCGYFSNMWIGGPFSVLLKLSPFENNKLIPSSYFEELPESFRNDKNAMWIKKRSLRRWKFQVLYHPYVDKPAVEYLVVRATYPAMSVDPNYLKRLIKKVLGETWQINYLNSSFDLSVNFDEHLQYDVISRSALLKSGINITESFGCFPTWVFCQKPSDILAVVGSTRNPSDKNKYNKELLLPFSTFTKPEFSDGLVISKLFLCNQVDLLYDEYDYTCSYVYFRVKKSPVDTFDVVKPTGYNVSDESNKPGIRVCLHEFANPQNDSNTPTILCILLFGTAYVSMSTLYNKIV